MTTTDTQSKQLAMLQASYAILLDDRNMYVEKLRACQSELDAARDRIAELEARLADATSRFEPPDPEDIDTPPLSTAGEYCWHCGDSLVPRGSPHCERCPAEGDCDV